MAAKVLQVNVQADFIDRLTVARPVLAIAELIWNALDADATDVRVILNNNAQDQIESITVADNGHGIVYAEAESLFGNLGGSWKRMARVTKGRRRRLHGEAGKGRFRALGLGRAAEWSSTATDGKRKVRFNISLNRDNPRRFVVTEPKPVSDKTETGVEVTVYDLYRNYRFEAARDELIQILALYLTDYSDAKVTFDGIKLDPREMIVERTPFTLSPVATRPGPPSRVALDLVEWKQTVERNIYLCSDAGFPITAVPASLHAPRFNFTGYLRSPHIDLLASENALDTIGELDPGLATALTEARNRIREHFKAKAAADARGVIETWKTEQVYPYEGEAETTVAVAERQVFDIVALNVARLVPNFDATEIKAKRFQLRMLRHAIERGPAELRLILTQVLDLPKKKQEEFAKLLEQTTLSAIITAAKMVADRLQFLDGLEEILFRAESKAQLKERTQLHRILAENTWLFGEEYALSVSDQRLTEVLRKHLAAQGRDIAVDEPVKTLDGKKGVVDLMLSRSIPSSQPQQLEHLVIELKAPKVDIDQKAVTQLEGYANAVATDERFRLVDARWSFWIVSNDLAPYAIQRLRGAPSARFRPGLFHDAEEPPIIRMWMKTWGQLTTEARARLTVFQKELNFSLDRNDSLRFLHETYARFLADDGDEAASDVAEEEQPDGEPEAAGERGGDE